MIIDSIGDGHRQGLADDYYKPASLVMLRTPLLHVGAYRDAFALPDLSRERLLEAMGNPAFLEMLGIASPALLERIEAFHRDPNNFSSKRSEDLLGAVARYLIRATTRPTPFGAFAGVAVGLLGQTAELRLDSPSAGHVVARLDYAVVLRLVHDLERDSAFRPYLQVFANPALFRWGDRVYLDYRDSYGQGKSSDPISVRATPPLQQVLARTQTPQSYDALLDRLCETYPDKNRERLDSFLNSLMDQSILLSTLRPPQSDPDPLSHLSRALPPAYEGPLRFQVDELKAGLDRYNRTPLGQGLTVLKDLCSRVQEIGTTPPTQLQVDAKLAMKGAAIPKSMAEEISRAVLALMRIWPFSKTSAALREYAHEFGERYGSRQEIPLLAVLNNEIGLGSPPRYLNPPPGRVWTYPPPEESKQHKEWLSQLLGETLQAGCQEILLDETMIRHFEFDPAGLPPSLDVFVSLAARDAEAMNRGEYLAVLGAAGASSPAGRALGRFAYLDAAFRDYLEKMAAQEADQNPDVVFADLIYTHPRGHSNNVAIHPCTFRHQIAVATTPTVPFDQHIPLNDLLVGVVGGCFYLRSQTLGKQVLVRTANLLNPAFAPNAVRFILAVAGGNNFDRISWNWGGQGLMPFLPRVRFGKVVLSPARWRLPQTLGAQEDDVWTETLAAWRDRFRVPSHIYLGDLDNRLLLDLNNPLHRKIIHRAALRGPVVVEEPLPALDHAPVSDQEGNAHMLEAVVSLLLRDPKPVVPIPKASGTYEYPERIRLPGEDCLYLKLYGPRSLQDDLLIDLQTIVAGLAPELDRWFFLRYHDPEQHLRLRFFGESDFLLNQALPKLCAALRPLYAKGFLTRAAVDSYERETERYGGREGIFVCEEVFAQDSSALVSLLQLYRGCSSAFEWENLTLLSLDVLFQGLGFDRLERKAIYHLMSQAPASGGLEDKTARRKYLSGLVRRKREGIWNQLNTEWVAGQPGGEALLAWVQAFEYSLAPLKDDLWRLEQSGRLFRPRLEIAASLGHMHCNRAGFRPSEEQDSAYVLERVCEGLIKYAPEAVVK